jgi:hypothetical protein
MAVRVGTEGSVTMSDTSGGSIDGMTIRRWTASFPRPENDVTPFSPTNNARKGLGGNRSINGSFEGFLDDTTPVDLTDYENPKAAAANIVLIYNEKPANGNTKQGISFVGFLSNISIGVSAKGEPNTISANFTGAGAAVWATTA